MSGYIRAHRFELEFDGETITCNLKPLELIDALTLRAAAVKEDNDSYIRHGLELLPKYVTEFVGPTDAAGVAVPLDEVVRVAYFSQISVGIVRALTDQAGIRNPSRSDGASTTASSEANGATRITS